MCGTGSIEVVFGVTNGKAGTKVLFLMDNDGNIGTSHSAIRTAYKLGKDRKMVNVNFVDGECKYEKGIPSWYGKFQKATEKQIATLVTKTIPAYLKAVHTATVARDRKIESAIDVAQNVYAKSVAAAFKKTGALPL
jgi:hypothetical protein